MNNDINNSFEELNDDELDKITGGLTEAYATEQGNADGRTCPLPAGTYYAGTCACAAHNKKARERRSIPSTANYPATVIYRYVDVKCYNCGKTWASIDYNK